MNILISNNSDIPIYQQIKNQIKDAILSGELTDGEILPSIRNLANETRVSVLTTRRAYDELEKEGFVKSVPGKGSFVAAKNTDVLREAKLLLVEENLLKAYEAGKSVGISKEDLYKMMELLFDEERMV